MKKITLRLALASLVAASIAGAALQSAQAGGASLQQGNLTAVVTDCQTGPWFMGEGLGPGGPGYFVPAVVKNQNCISVDAFIVDPMNNGTLSVKIPQGLTVTKKIAAPKNITWYGDTSGCSWSGSWSLQSAGTAQTLKLTGLTCGAYSYLAAFFTATVKNPTTMTYQPYNLANADHAHSLFNCGGSYYGGADYYDALWWVFNGSPSFFLSAYYVTGQYTTSKGATALATNPTYFGIAPDNDYYTWMFDLVYNSNNWCVG